MCGPNIMTYCALHSQKCQFGLRILWPSQWKGGCNEYLLLIFLFAQPCLILTCHSLYHSLCGPEKDSWSLDPGWAPVPCSLLHHGTGAHGRHTWWLHCRTLPQGLWMQVITAAQNVQSRAAQRRQKSPGKPRTVGCHCETGGWGSVYVPTVHLGQLSVETEPPSATAKVPPTHPGLGHPPFPDWTAHDPGSVNILP